MKNELNKIFNIFLKNNIWLILLLMGIIIGLMLYSNKEIKMINDNKIEKLH